MSEVAATHEPARTGPRSAPGPATSAQLARDARFRLLVEAHFDFIWRSLRGLGVPPDAVDDAAQHVFLIAHEKLGSIVSGCERAFLFKTALGVAANARRARKRRREVADDAAIAEQPDARPDPERLAQMKQARERLDEVLEAMAPELRAVFLLFELEGLTMAEIAPILELAPGTVASRLRRAREQFRALSRSLGGEP